MVIDLAERAGLKVTDTDLIKEDLYDANEMFLTGTAAEVIPVSKVDGRPIGEGRPGPVTLQLIDAFRQFVSNEAPED